MAREEVELTLAGALFGRDPRGFIDFLGLNGRPLGDNRWAVWPSNDKVFISHHGLADDTEFVNRFDHLTHLPMNNTHLDDPAVIARFAEHDRQLAERMAAPDITAVFHSIQSDILKCSTHDQTDHGRRAGMRASRNTRAGFNWRASVFQPQCTSRHRNRPLNPASSIACDHVPLRPRSGRDGNDRQQRR